MIKIRHLFLIAGLAFAGALPLSAGPAAADAVVGVGAHVGDVGVHVRVGDGDHHRHYRRYYRHYHRGYPYRWNGRYYRHRRHACSAWGWHHHARACRRWAWRYY